MADPLPAINIDQLTNSVNSVLASNGETEYSPSSGVIGKPPETDRIMVTPPATNITVDNPQATQHTVINPQSTSQCAENLLATQQTVSTSSVPALPVMILAYIGGRPTLFPLTDQLTGGKFPQATSTSAQPVIHQVDSNYSNRMTPLPAFPVSLPQLYQAQNFPANQPLPHPNDTQQLTNQTEGQHHSKNSAGQILIRPKPPVSTSSAPVFEFSQPVQSIPTSVGPALPRAVTPVPSHRVTPIDLQALINQCAQSPALTLQSGMGQSTSNSLLHLGPGEVTLDHTAPQGDLLCNGTPQSLTNLSGPSPQSNLIPGLHNQLHINNSALVTPPDLVGSGGGNPETAAMMDNQAINRVPTSLPLGDHSQTTDHTPLNNVQQLMTSLDVLSPVTNGDCQMTVFDLFLKAHSNELSLEKSGTDVTSKTPICQTDAHSMETPAPSNVEPLNMFFCVECNSRSESQCKVHQCNFKRVLDKPILTKARMTLPDVLCLSQSTVSSNLPGVWTKTFISHHTVFGPVVGELKSAHECDKDKRPNFFTWKIFYEGKTEGISVSDENLSNWMRFVKPARTAKEQNIVAYQQGREIFFVTCQDIDETQELLLWYSKDYAKALGMPSTPGTMATCNVCSKSFPNAKSLGQHVKYSHPDMSTRKWKCEYCGRGFNSSSKLKSHVLSHMGVKPFVCSECGKKFTEKPNLTRHMYIHTGERNFECSICGRGFRQKAHLQSHILVHTGERTIRCRYCEKLFARTSDLKQHEYQHTKEKVFTCPQCNKVFYKLQNFKKHSKIHLGQKDFPCYRCGKSFFTRYHVKRHLNTCKGTNSQYTLEPEDPEIVALNMDPCVPGVCPDIPNSTEPCSQSPKRVKHKGKGKK